MRGAIRQVSAAKSCLVFFRIRCLDFCCKIYAELRFLRFDGVETRLTAINNAPCGAAVGINACNVERPLIGIGQRAYLRQPPITHPHVSHGAIRVQHRPPTFNPSTTHTHTKKARGTSTRSTDSSGDEGRGARGERRRRRRRKRARPQLFWVLQVAALPCCSLVAHLSNSGGQQACCTHAPSSQHGRKHKAHTHTSSTITSPQRTGICKTATHGFC